MVSCAFWFLLAPPTAISGAQSEYNDYGEGYGDYQDYGGSGGGDYGDNYGGDYQDYGAAEDNLYADYAQRQQNKK